MSLPKVIIQIAITGVQIFGRAFFEAGKQAVKNAKHRPQNALGGDVAGVGNATSGSATDQLTRSHRMTLDEAHLILNVKRGEEMEVVLKHYEHMFKANGVALPKREGRAAPAATKGKPNFLPSNSHYLQSKVVRARERIEAELKVKQEPPAPPPPADAPPPPPPASS